MALICHQDFTLITLENWVTDAGLIGCVGVRPEIVKFS
jgi:hypothetical protein